MVTNSDFKKYLENLFSESFINIEDLDLKIEKSWYLGGGSSFDDFRDFYGDQDIFKQRTQNFIDVVNQLFANSYKPAFSELLLYAGFQRYETAVFQGTKKTLSMGRWRVPSKIDAIVDPLIKYRCLNATNFIQRFLDTDLPLNQIVNFEGSDFLFTFENETINVNCYDLDLGHNSYLSVNLIPDNCGYYSSLAPNGKYYIFLNELYEKCVESEDLKDIGRLHFYLCRRVPYVRGGGTIAEWIAAALMIKSGYNFTGWSKNPFMEPWSVAITSGVERFIDIYSQIADL